MDLHEFMQDEHLAKAMDLALKLISDPHIDHSKAAALVVRFEALSMKFGMLASTYMTIKAGRAGTEENKRKNVYFTARELCHNMAQSLKYSARIDY